MFKYLSLSIKNTFNLPQRTKLNFYTGLSECVKNFSFDAPLYGKDFKSRRSGNDEKIIFFRRIRKKSKRYLPRKESP